MAHILAKLMKRMFVFLLPILIEVAIQALRDRKYHETQRRWELQRRNQYPIRNEHD